MARAFLKAQCDRARHIAEGIADDVADMIGSDQLPQRVLGSEMDGWSNSDSYTEEEERRITQATRLIKRELGLYLLKQSRRK